VFEESAKAEVDDLPVAIHGSVREPMGLTIIAIDASQSLPWAGSAEPTPDGREDLCLGLVAEVLPMSRNPLA
jgi:hypothetical protein